MTEVETSIHWQDRYTWEAEYGNGRIVTVGPDQNGSLEGVVRFSLIPHIILLPRHDFLHVRMVRRFARGFIKPFRNGLFDYLHCVVFETHRVYVSSRTGSVMITPRDKEIYI